MKISDFIRVNDSARTLYNVYRGDKLVDVIKNDYLTQDPKIIPEAVHRINYLMDANGYVERFHTWYDDDFYQIWLHVDVQIGAQDYPDRL